MPTDLEIWDGNEWEAHVLRLLHDRHGPTNIQKVPAKHKGDCGIDCYCLSSSVVYQCYAVQEPVAVAARADKQKSKITTDIGKFCDPTKGAAQLFKDHPIKRWILVVPLHDSQEVNQHAVKKSKDVLALGLSHVSPDFEILVQDREDFDEESYLRRSQERARLRIPSQPATAQDLASLTASSSHLVDNLRRKMTKRLRDGESLDDVAEDAMREFIESQNAMDSLRRTAPTVHEEIVAFTNQRLRRLRLAGAKHAAPGEVLENEIGAFIIGLQGRLPTLDPNAVEQLALGTVSEWLMRCPLDFN